MNRNTALKLSGDWQAGDVNSFVRDNLGQKVDTVANFRLTSFESQRWVYCYETVGTYKLDLMSAAADDGVTVIIDAESHRYIRESTAGEPTFSAIQAGIVPASGGGTSNFLRADGTWTAIGSMFVSILTFIPDAEHAAIANHTSTYDCKADIEAAVVSLGAYGGTVFHPPGRYNVSAKITITTPVYLVGAGRGFNATSSVIRGTHATSGDIVEFSGTTCGGISSVGLTCSNGVVTGDAIKAVNGCFELQIEKLAIWRVFNCINVEHASETHISKITAREIFGIYFINYGNTAVGACYGLNMDVVTFDNPTRSVPYGSYGPRRGNWTVSTGYLLHEFVIANGNIYQCTFAGNSAGSGSGPSGFGVPAYDGEITDGTAKWKFYCNAILAGFRFDSFAYSARIKTASFIDGAYGVLMTDTQNTGASWPYWLFCFDLECDHNYYCSTWLRYGEGFFVTTSWLGSCLEWSGVIFDTTWKGESGITNSRIVASNQHGILINGGVNCDISHNIIGANSQAASGANHGIFVGSNINEFTIMGNKIGDLHSLVEKQGYGVLVNVGTSNNYIISGNRCHDNVTGKVSDGGTGVNKSVTGNI